MRASNVALDRSKAHDVRGLQTSALRDIMKRVSQRSAQSSGLSKRAFHSHNSCKTDGKPNIGDTNKKSSHADFDPAEEITKLLRGFWSGTQTGDSSGPGFSYKWALLAAAAVLLYIFRPIRIVPAGHVGVLDLFGDVREKPLMPGIHLVNPLVRMINFSTKTQLFETTTNAPSSEGLMLGLEVNVLFRLHPDAAPEMYKTVGRPKEYADIVLSPRIMSSIRRITSRYASKALYTSQSRDLISSELEEQLQQAVKDLGLHIEEVPLRNITLPPQIRRSIEDKLSAEQESQRMEFVLQKEQSEAQRKAIEAQGIADFQKIVSEGISEPLLKWKGIEATEHLANSANSKIVIIGSGKDGLPLILGGDLTVDANQVVGAVSKVVSEMARSSELH